MAQSIPVHKGSIWHFSQIEVEHLIQATMAFTIAWRFMTTGGVFGAINNIGAFIIGGAIYFIALSPAFVLHELAHKFSARKYGCWAEFRASPSGLRFGVFLSSDWNSFHGPRSRDGGRQHHKVPVWQDSLGRTSHERRTMVGGPFGGSNRSGGDIDTGNDTYALDVG